MHKYILPEIHQLQKPLEYVFCVRSSKIEPNEDAREQKYMLAPNRNSIFENGCQGKRRLATIISAKPSKFWRLDVAFFIKCTENVQPLCLKQHQQKQRQLVGAPLLLLALSCLSFLITSKHSFVISLRTQTCLFPIFTVVLLCGCVRGVFLLVLLNLWISFYQTCWLYNLLWMCIHCLTIFLA